MSIFKSILEVKLKNCTTNIRIFVTGETGQGKSTLINSIIEKKVAKVVTGFDRCTTEVKEYKKLDVTPEISVSLFDSPGLQDNTGNEDSYIRALEEICIEADLVFYCKKMGDRFKNDDTEAMRKLTNRFGEKFWSRVVFIFTFANKIDDDDDEDNSFQSILQDSAEKIKKHLREVILINHTIVDQIPFLPAGKYIRDSKGSQQQLQLPGIDNWLQSMLDECCVQIIERHKLQKLNLSHRKYNVM